MSTKLRVCCQFNATGINVFKNKIDLTILKDLGMFRCGILASLSCAILGSRHNWDLGWQFSVLLFDVHHSPAGLVACLPAHLASPNIDGLLWCVAGFNTLHGTQSLLVCVDYSGHCQLL